MKIQLIGMVVFLLFILPVFSLPSRGESPAQLVIKIFGGLPFPFFFHIVGGVIENVGDTTAYNITYELTIHGGFVDGINETSMGYRDEILPKSGLSIGIIDTYGFGPVEIILTASGSNAENATEVAKGIQLGGFTWVPFSWITP